MNILAIDPGNVKSAYVVLDDSLTIHAKRILPNDELLEIVTNPVLVETGLVDTLVIEMVQSFGMAVGKEVFETVFWIGRFCQAWRGRDFQRIYRMQVKMHLCGNSRAKDPNIRQALLDKLGPPGTKKAPGPTYGVSSDIWSALAVGVTWIESNGLLRPA